VEACLHRPRDETRERRLAETGRAAEEEMPQGLAAGAGGLDGELEVRDEAPLADEVAKAPGAEGRGREAVGLPDAFL
jgi:hypothetical protein